MKKYKDGEREAYEILSNIGIELDESYYDDNSQKSMPDLMYSNGRKIEVTHTDHNKNVFKHENKYVKEELEDEKGEVFRRHYEIDLKAWDAIERIKNFDYDRDSDGRFTQEAEKIYKSDLKLLKTHLGYDPTKRDIHDQFSEFKCDSPIIHFDTDSILRKIDEKAEKYHNKETDLFLFVVDTEYRLMIKLISQMSYNGSAQAFLKHIYDSVFPTIYICSWDIYRQEYEIQKPMVIRFDKTDNGLRFEWYNTECEEEIV